MIQMESTAPFREFKQPRCFCSLEYWLGKRGEIGGWGGSSPPQSNYHILYGCNTRWEKRIDICILTAIWKTGAFFLVIGMKNIRSIMENISGETLCHVMSYLIPYRNKVILNNARNNRSSRTYKTKIILFSLFWMTSRDIYSRTLKSSCVSQILLTGREFFRNTVAYFNVVV